MVIINLKISEKNQFLYETPSSIEIVKLKKELCLVNNLRVNIDRISLSLEELLKFGPLKPEESRGLNITEDIDCDIEDKYKVPKTKMPEKIGTRYNEDPSHQRTGWILEAEVTDTVLKGVMDAKAYINSKRAEEKKSTTLKELFDTLDMLKAGVMIGYPGYYGLAEWEMCKILLEDKQDLSERDEPNYEYQAFSTTSMWNAGKEYENSKILSDYIGKNEKTKIVCKFSKKGSGAPVREPLIDKETHSKMLSFYFKKQEEQKKLEVENDDSYLNSKWADGNGLKKSMYHGDKDINWKYK